MTPPGSVWAAFVIGGSTSSTTAVIQEIWTQLQQGTFTVSFNGQTLVADPVMYVDNQDFFNAIPVSITLDSSLGLGVKFKLSETLALKRFSDVLYIHSTIDLRTMHVLLCETYVSR